MVSDVSQTAWMNCSCVFSWSHRLCSALSSAAMSPSPKWRGENPFTLSFFVTALQLKYCFNSLNFRYLEKNQRVIHCGLFFILFWISTFVYMLYFSLWSPLNCPLLQPHIKIPHYKLLLLLTEPRSLLRGRSVYFLAGNVIDLEVKVFTVLVFSKCSSSTAKLGNA